MDPPPFYHHRYAAPHDPPAYPGSNPNFIPHHHLSPPPPPPHHHHPPPPPPPPQHLPPPSSPFYHHHLRSHSPFDQYRSQFFNFIPHHLLSSSSSRVSEENNNIFNIDNHRDHYRHRWVESPPRCRVQADQLPPPPPPPLPPLPPPTSNFFDNHRPRLNFRSEYNGRSWDDLCGDNGDRFRYGWDNSELSVTEDQRWGPNDVKYDAVVNDIDEKYPIIPDDRYRDNGRFDENSLRWGRYSPHNVGMERDQECRSPQRELCLHGYGSGKFSNRTKVREGGQEFFNRLPSKKPVQRKSALLRIQLGEGVNSSSNRNRSCVYTPYSKGYLDETSTGGTSCRQKSSVRSDCRVEEKREKSPIELDVSFKSNSLVAKAVNPLSSTIDTDRDLTARSRKTRKVNLLSSPVTKPSEGSCKSNNSADGVDGHCSARETRKHSSVAGSLKPSTGNDIVSSNRSASISASQPSSTVSNDIDENATTTVSPIAKGLDGGGNLSADRGTASQSIKKRKKVANTSPEPVKHDAVLSIADTVSNNCAEVSQLFEGKKHLKLIDVSADMASKNCFFSLPCSDEAILNKRYKTLEGVVLKNNSTKDPQLDEGVEHPEQSNLSAGVVSEHCTFLLPSSDAVILKKSYKSSEGVVSEKDHADIDSSWLSSPNPKMKSKFSSTFPNVSGACESGIFNSLGNVSTRSNDGADQAEKPNGSCDYESNPDTYLVQLECPTTRSSNDGLVDLIEQPLENGLALPEKDISRSLEGTVSVQGFLNQSRTKEMEIPTVHLNNVNRNIDDCGYAYSIDDVEHTATDSNGECYGKSEGTADSEGSSDSGSKELLVIQTIESLGIDIHQKDRNLSCSDSLKTTCLIMCSSTACGKKRNVSGLCSLDDGSRKSCFDQSVVPLENVVDRGCPNAIVSVGSSEDHSSKIERKRKAMDKLSLLVEDASEIPANVSSNGNDEGAAVNILVKKQSASKEIFHHDQDHDSLCGYTSEDGSLDMCVSDQTAVGIDLNVTSSGYLKKRKTDEGLTAVPSTLDADVSSCGNYGKAESGSRITDVQRLLLSADTFIENGTAGASSRVESTGNGVFGQSRNIQLMPSSSIQSGADLEDNTASFVSKTKHQFGRMDMVNEGNAELFSDMEMDQGLPGRDSECHFSLPVKENLESMTEHSLSCTNGESVSAKNSVDEVIVSFPGSLSHMGTGNVLGLDTYLKASVSQISDEKVCQNVKGLLEKPQSANDSEFDRRAGPSVVRSLPVGTTIASSPSQVAGKLTRSRNTVSVKSNLSKNHLISSSPQVISGRQSRNLATLQKAGSLSHIAKPRTWRRSGNGSVTGPMTQFNSITQQNCSQKKVGTSQSTYIRKGNCLVRKPSPIGAASQRVYASRSSVSMFNPPGVDNSNMVLKSDAGNNDLNPQISATTGGPGASEEKTHILPLCSGFEISTNSAKNINNSTLCVGADSSERFSSVSRVGSQRVPGNMDLLKSAKDVMKSSERLKCQTGAITTTEGQSVLDERDAGHKIIYVKRRSNQLIAALGNRDNSANCVDKMQTSSADGYYKRKNNQLIRTSLENHIQESIAADDLQKQGHHKLKQPSKSNARICKPSKFSFVWTLSDTESLKGLGGSARSHKVLPYLFPWRRAVYLRNSTCRSNACSLSSICRKLLLLRKRQTIYTRSTSGFSLRRSKVLSIGGSNLKWSKSIEKNSKNANEEATLAVAAAEKIKKEQKNAASAVLNRRNHVSRERVFRIGLQRYKMDPTGKTLHRISNGKDQLLSVPQAEKHAKRCYVPSRLLIGNDQYVRIGNGNQLIRDPKKRTRTLASEKVRWSLHTARLRLAKKKKFCQFFTRFGKCNKDDGKCPYIHDLSKVAVCTKFLNGSCSDPNCKLTHEVIPERMPDCSYFLQGLCSNENCAYRHVNVNPSSSVCENFLRGYCADGNECRKKHTYVCLVFEATGVCPQGSKCKLHHPKKRRGRRNPLKELKNVRGRYFGPNHTEMTGRKITGFEKLFQRSDDDIFCQDGIFAEYISLDVSDEEVEAAVNFIVEKTSDPGPTDAQVSTLDDLIKPVLLMSKYRTADSTPEISEDPNFL